MPWTRRKHLILGVAGEFDHRPAAGEAVTVLFRVGDGRIGQLRRRGIARRARDVEAVGRGLQGKGLVLGQCILSHGVLRAAEVHADIKLNAAQVDTVSAFLGGIEPPVTGYFRGDVLARAVFQGELSAAGERQGVRLTCGKPLVIHRR